jgi:hypothetical protein
MCLIRIFLVCRFCAFYRSPSTKACTRFLDSLHTCHQAGRRTLTTLQRNPWPCIKGNFLFRIGAKGPTLSIRQMWASNLGGRMITRRSSGSTIHWLETSPKTKERETSCTKHWIIINLSNFFASQCKEKGQEVQGPRTVLARIKPVDSIIIMLHHSESSILRLNFAIGNVTINPMYIEPDSWDVCSNFKEAHNPQCINDILRPFYNYKSWALGYGHGIMSHNDQAVSAFFECFSEFFFMLHRF